MMMFSILKINETEWTTWTRLMIAEWTTWTTRTMLLVAEWTTLKIAASEHQSWINGTIAARKEKWNNLPSLVQWMS
jgi:hypothetical protein